MKKYIITIALVLSATSICAQNSSAKGEYRRSSLYQIMINHREQKFADDIQDVFLQMPVSAHFNDHDLSVKVVDMETKLQNANSDKENQDVTNWLTNNKVASRLVAKWFDRDMFTGQCDMELIKQRGLYNASAIDRIMAEKSIRGNAILEDAGEDLIGNTFVIVNDIRYQDHQTTTKAVSTGMKILGGAAKFLIRSNVTKYTDRVADQVADVISSIKGFRVKINTYLYKLEWNDDIAAQFYQDQYGVEANSPAKEAFDDARANYTLKYVGKQESSGSTTSVLGINLDTPTAMVRKACQRAVDENIANLQHNYEEFRTKSPLLCAEPITAAIGLKEGITDKSVFEVLEAVEKNDGTVTYRKVGEIQPIKSLIWDNRYMSVEEQADNATLGFTTFKKLSGSDFYPGMLIRETTSKKK